MKSTSDQKNIKLPSYHIKPELDRYNGVILFPEKAKKAKESIRKYGLPGQELIAEAQRKK